MKRAKYIRKNLQLREDTFALCTYPNGDCRWGAADDQFVLVVLIMQQILG